MVGADASMGLNYRRRVIYQALRETFADPQQVRQYFDLWQREHSAEAHFVVTRFAASVAKAAGFDLQQKSIFQRRLFHGLTQPYDQLERVPEAFLSGEMPALVSAPPARAPTPASAPASAPPPVRAPAVAPAAPAATTAGSRFESAPRVVFKAFVQPLIAAVVAKADRHPGVMAQAVSDLDTSRNALEQRLFQGFRRWSAERFHLDALPLMQSEDDLRYVAHLLYLLAADLLGPMQADRLLAQAAADCERLPEAQTFSPQRLL